MPHCQDGISLSLSLYACPQRGDCRWEESQPGSSELHKGFVQRETEPKEPCLTFSSRAPEATQPHSHHFHPDTACTKNRGRDSDLGGGRAEFCKNLWDGGISLWNLQSAESAASQFPELCFHISWCFSPPHLLIVWSPTSSSPAADYPVSGAAELTLSAACMTPMDTQTSSLETWFAHAKTRFPSSLKVCHIYLAYGVARKVTWRMRMQTNENTPRLTLTVRMCLVLGRQVKNWLFWCPRGRWWSGESEVWTQGT